MTSLLLIMFFCVCFFNGTGVWTQYFKLAKQVLYQLSHTSSSFCCAYFGDRVSLCLGWPHTAILLISASKTARITRVSHQHLALILQVLYHPASFDSFLKPTLQPPPPTPATHTFLPSLPASWICNSLKGTICLRFVSTKGQQPFIMIMLEGRIDTPLVGKQCYNLLFSFSPSPCMCIHCISGYRLKEKFTSLCIQEIRCSYRLKKSKWAMRGSQGLGVWDNRFSGTSSILLPVSCGGNSWIWFTFVRKRLLYSKTPSPSL
jgi:hypothetical protein